MKKRNMAKLALMGLASGLLFSGQASADEVPTDLNLSDGSSEMARGKCGSSGCSQAYQPSSRDRRYGNPTNQNMNKKGNSCGSCNGENNNGKNGKMNGEHCGAMDNNGKNGEMKGSCKGPGGCGGGDTAQQTNHPNFMREKRNSTMQHRN